MERRIALFLTIAAVLWAAAMVLTPFAFRQSSALALARTIRAAGSLVCHQRVERSFTMADAPLPVCARCTGLYLSGAAGALAAWLVVPVVPLMPRRTRATVLFAAAPTLVTVAIEWAGLASPGNTVRAMAAVPLGAACGWVFVRMLRAESSPTRSVSH